MKVIYIVVLLLISLFENEDGALGISISLVNNIPRHTLCDY
jgi:hypothetical protein